MLRSTLRNTIPFCTLAAVLLAGCGDDSTGPSIPNVAGLYQFNQSLAAVTCLPTRPPAGGTVILDAFSDSYRVRIQQDGSRLTITYPDFPNEPPSTGSVDQEGNVGVEESFTFKEEPREGNRTFYVDLAIKWNVRRQDDGRLQGSGTYVNVFHEGAPTAPVFTTCSRGSTITLTRTGN